MGITWPEQATSLLSVSIKDVQAFRDQLRSQNAAPKTLNALCATRAVRASVALRFVERWNDPKLAELRNQWHEIYYDLKTLQPADVILRLDEDIRARTVVTDMLNFCEEIAQAVNAKAADETLIRRLLCDTIRDYYSTLLPWIQNRRATRPDAWENIKLMLDRWSS